MVRRNLVIVLAALILSPAVPARAVEWRFKWQPGQVLNYRVEQVTTASEVVDGKKAESSSKLNNTKRWQVLGVDAAGIATLQLSLTSLRVETKSPEGEVMLFDSADPQSGTPQMREQLSKFIGQPLVVLRVDGRGKVIEVKDCKHGPASRFESEPPFIINLPEKAPQPNDSWVRNYQITLEPPQGTGEKFDAYQTYVCRSLDGGRAVFSLTTTMKSLPPNVADQMPLLQFEPEGRVLFDSQAGRLQQAVSKIDKELTGQQGDGSSYHFQSTYSEEFVGEK